MQLKTKCAVYANNIKLGTNVAFGMSFYNLFENIFLGHFKWAFLVLLPAKKDFYKPDLNNYCLEKIADLDNRYNLSLFPKNKKRKYILDDDVIEYNFAVFHFKKHFF